MKGVFGFAVLFASDAAASEQVPLGKTIKLNNGVEMTTVNLGTCCGSDPKVGLAPWLKSGGVGIDTAFDYKDQQDIGKVLKEQKIQRESVFITSKIPAGLGNPFTDCREDPNIAIKYAQENVKELGVDYVDLLLLHAPCFGRPKSNAALWKGLKQAMDMNLTRAIGVSNYNSAQLEALPAPKPAVNQCNMGVNTHDDATISYCQQNGILYEAYYVMHNCPFSDSRITDIAKSHNVSASQVCQRYVLDKGVAMAVGTGSDPTKAAKEAPENLGVFGFHLTDEEFKTVDSIQKKGAVVV
jgi:diketogulonate reductase-like aldo/keto reductase